MTIAVRRSVGLTTFLLCGVVTLVSCNVPPRDRESVKREHDAVPPPPASHLITREVVDKRGYSAVHSKYESTLAPEAAGRHYDHWLRLAGWRLRATRQTQSWGKPTDGWSRDYCKGQLKASLQYAGTAPNDWKYAFSISLNNGDPTCRATDAR